MNISLPFNIDLIVIAGRGNLKREKIELIDQQGMKTQIMYKIVSEGKGVFYLAKSNVTNPMIMAIARQMGRVMRRTAPS
jgi:hypothetical protein